MQYFKKRTAAKLNKPSTYSVTLAQLALTMVLSSIAAIADGEFGLSILAGSLIAIIGQAYYNSRALKYFGTIDSSFVVSTTYSAMWGKWLIVVSASLACVLVRPDFNAGALYLGLFIVHTFGAFLLPVLVRRAP